MKLIVYRLVNPCSSRNLPAVAIGTIKDGCLARRYGGNRFFELHDDGIRFVLAGYNYSRNHGMVVSNFYFAVKRFAGLVFVLWYICVSKMNTLGVSMMANSERCSAEFENGEQLWPENLCMLVLMEMVNTNKRYRLG